VTKDKGQRTDDKGQRTDYLIPYLRAAAVHGAGFESLLWASRGRRRHGSTRSLGYGVSGESRCSMWVRSGGFPGVSDRTWHAASRLCWHRGGGGAGRRGERRLSRAASARPFSGRLRPRAAPDVRGADVIVFSGSLNTLPEESFYQTLRLAWDATASGLVFNFLDSPTLAAARYLHWRRPGDVLAFARGPGRRPRSHAARLSGRRLHDRDEEEMLNAEYGC